MGGVSAVVVVLVSKTVALRSNVVVEWIGWVVMMVVVVVSVSYALELRSGMSDRPVLGTDVLIGTLAGVLVDVLVDTVIGVVCDIGDDVLAGVEVSSRTIAAPALELVPMLASSEDALFVGWRACSCCPTTAKGCRALQAWMPSCHVCSRFAVLEYPQVPNQDPPRAQQLSLPDF